MSDAGVPRADISGGVFLKESSEGNQEERALQEKSVLTSVLVL